MKSDPVIDRVREARHEISARFEHDPKKLTAYYIERQKRHMGQLICTTPPSPDAARPDGYEDLSAPGDAPF